MWIVVINPDVIIGKSLGLVLSEAGHEVVSFTHSERAVTLVCLSDIDAVLLEANLDNGFAARLPAQLRAQEYHGPILLVAERDEPHEYQSAFDAGATGPT